MGIAHWEDLGTGGGGREGIGGGEGWGGWPRVTDPPADGAGGGTCG